MFAKICGILKNGHSEKVEKIIGHGIKKIIYGRASVVNAGQDAIKSKVK